MDNPVAQRGGKKGKKDRKKKGFDDDWYNFYLIRPTKVYLMNTLSLIWREVKEGMIESRVKPCYAAHIIERVLGETRCP